MTMTEAEDPVEVEEVEEEGEGAKEEVVEEGGHLVEEVVVGMEGGMGTRVTEVTTTTATRNRRNVTPNGHTNTVERPFDLNLPQIVLPTMRGGSEDASHRSMMDKEVMMIKIPDLTYCFEIKSWQKIVG